MAVNTADEGISRERAHGPPTGEMVQGDGVRVAMCQPSTVQEHVTRTSVERHDFRGEMGAASWRSRPAGAL